MPENPASYRVVRTKSYLFNKAHLAIILYMNEKGIAVPPEALHQDINGVTWVNYRAAEEGPIKKIEVKTGKSVVQGIEVKGLEAGYIEVPLK
ncbi:hypothetical protein [Cronobacter sakazakii]|uniref:hypothetical protein n=1 Tax=Cronobacter sakazakii TaxID=28141 RepID=UPI000CFBA6CE|nr:hypothetical protein [Cronobacter sakazakii]